MFDTAPSGADWKPDLELIRAAAVVAGETALGYFRKAPDVRWKNEGRSQNAADEWSGRLDLNQRPPAPEAGALPGYATPRHYTGKYWRTTDSQMRPRGLEPLTF